MFPISTEMGRELASADHLQYCLALDQNSLPYHTLDTPRHSHLPLTDRKFCFPLREAEQLAQVTQLGSGGAGIQTPSPRTLYYTRQPPHRGIRPKQAEAFPPNSVKSGF